DAGRRRHEERRGTAAHHRHHERAVSGLPGARQQPLGRCLTGRVGYRMAAARDLDRSGRATPVRRDDDPADARCTRDVRRGARHRPRRLPATDDDDRATMLPERPAGRVAQHERAGAVHEATPEELPGFDGFERGGPAGERVGAEPLKRHGSTSGRRSTRAPIRARTMATREFEVRSNIEEFPTIWQRVVTDPLGFFAEMPETGGLAQPGLFLALFAGINAVGHLLFFVGVGGAEPPLLFPAGVAFLWWAGLGVVVPAPAH